MKKFRKKIFHWKNWWELKWFLMDIKTRSMIMMIQRCGTVLFQSKLFPTSAFFFLNSDSWHWFWRYIFFDFDSQLRLWPLFSHPLSTPTPSFNSVDSFRLWLTTLPPRLLSFYCITNIFYSKMLEQHEICIQINSGAKMFYYITVVISFNVNSLYIFSTLTPNIDYGFQFLLTPTPDSDSVNLLPLAPTHNFDSWFVSPMP